MTDIAPASRKRKLDQTNFPVDERPRYISPPISDYSVSDDEDSVAGTDTPLTPITPRSPITNNTKKRPLKYCCDWPDCPKAFSRPVRLEEHKRSHTNDRIFKCPHAGCDKDFLRDSHLKLHIKDAHTDTRDYPCDWQGCDKAFSTGTRMRRHRAGHEKPKKHDFQCTGFPPCNERFRRDGNLQKHINSVHLQMRALRCSHQDPTTGQPCQSSFDKPVALRQHEAEYHGDTRFTCELCSDSGEAPMTFSTYNQLQAHRTLTHPPECEYCSLAFATKAQLRSHIDIVHNETATDESKQSPCPYVGCGKTFNKKGNLNVHVKTTHEGRKPFTCGGTDVTASAAVESWDGNNACGQSFTTKQSLAMHVRRHHMPDSKPKHVRKQENRARASAVDKLTGRSSQLACIVTTCDAHFDTETRLRRHATDVHGYSVDEAEALLLEQAAVTGGKFWIGGSGDDDFVEQDDFTGLDHEAIEVGGNLGRALRQQSGRINPNDNLEDDIKMAGMLSTYMHDSTDREQEDTGLIDPMLLNVKHEQA